MALGWVGGHLSLPPCTAPLRGPRQPGRPSVSSGDGEGPLTAAPPLPRADGEEGAPTASRPRAHRQDGQRVVSGQGRDRASIQSPWPGWHRPRARDGHTSSIRAGARLGGTDARGAACPARHAHRTSRPPHGRACWGQGAPPGRAEGTGRHRREGGGEGAGQALGTPSPLTLSRTTRSCCVSAAEPTAGPRSIPAHPRPTQDPVPPPPPPGSSEAPALAAPEELISGIFSWTRSAV